MPGYVYMLECENGTYYTGSTIDLDRRMQQHFTGMGANHTRKYSPKKLVYLEIHSRIDMAFRREKQIQGWSHQKKKALIEGDLNELHRLSECRNETHYRFWEEEEV
jgi:putative endonuclease